jgi:hypothetical protein
VTAGLAIYDTMQVRFEFSIRLVVLFSFCITDLQCLCVFVGSFSQCVLETVKVSCSLFCWIKNLLQGITSSCTIAVSSLHQFVSFIPLYVLKFFAGVFSIPGNWEHERVVNYW